MADTTVLLLPQEDTEMRRLRDDLKGQKDPDLFFYRCYEYFQAQGILNMVLARILDVFSKAILVFFVLFITVAVRFHDIREMLEKRDEPCPDGTARGALFLFRPDCDGNLPIDMSRMSPQATHSMLGVYITFAVLWVLYIVWSFTKLQPYFLIHKFFNEALKVPDSTLHTMGWVDFAYKYLSKKYGAYRICEPRDLDMWKIHALAFRFDNMLMALYPKLELILSIPLLGVPYLSTALHWTLKRVIKTVMLRHDRVWSVSKDIDDPAKLARKLSTYFWSFGLFYLLIFPVWFVVDISNFIFRNLDIIHNSPKLFTNQTWSMYAEWELAVFHEPPHSRKNRLKNAIEPAKNYVDLFRNNTLSLIANVVELLAGGMVSILILMLLVYDEGFISVNVVGDRSVGFCITILGVVLAVSRSVITTPPEGDEFKKKFAKMSGTLFMQSSTTNASSPSSVDDVRAPPDGATRLNKWEAWNDEPGSPTTYKEFTKLFVPRYVNVLFETVFSFLLTPIFLFRLACNSQLIVSYFEDNVVECKDVGHHDWQAALQVGFETINSTGVSRLPSEQPHDDMASSFRRDGSLFLPFILQNSRYSEEQARSLMPHSIAASTDNVPDDSVASYEADYSSFHD
eukprot:m.358487 g.358487  ORF g.358487 m.358487 type:complete len:625 (+) comp18157_c0_seq1:173-2047(+)